MNKRALLIEENPNNTASMKELLIAEKIEVYTSKEIQNAIKLMMNKAFDVVALNAGIKGASFILKILLEMEESQNMLLLLYPVLDSNTRSFYLRQGCDTCLAGDDPKECAAAICALFRRFTMRQSGTPGYISYKDLTIDPRQYKVTVQDKVVPLTATEFHLLYFLASNPNFVFSRETIYERVWQEDSAYGVQSVTNYISSIRKKLGHNSKSEEYIKTVCGIGYCFAHQ